jgi:hypothetical protein
VKRARAREGPRAACCGGWFAAIAHHFSFLGGGAETTIACMKGATLEALPKAK